MRRMSYCQALIEAQKEEMLRDSNVLIIGEDIETFGGCFGQTAGLFEKFGPERVMNMPISESGYVGMCVGLAMMGKRPIAELMFADFGGYAFDSIANQAVKMRYQSGGQWQVPMVIRAAQGAGVCAGETHSQCIEGWFQNVPALKIVVPSTPADALGLLKSAIREDDPVLFLEHKALMGLRGNVPDGDYTIPLGEANLVREGKDVTIIAYQVMLQHALAAASELSKMGIEVEVIDPRTIWPFDYRKIADSVSKTGRALIVHESPLRGGVGGEIAAFISDKCFTSLKAPVKRLGAADCFIPFNEAELFCYPGKDKIIAAVKDMMA
ncbi:MAG TPA: alpha-ketoacid dehydrogenase subunit beta [Clostridiales bacterium]|nr:alpha-ketoacid dehydrogenase subunit beta [Clostridiales bacterium]